VKFVLDASAVLSGVNLPATDEFVMPPLVEEELGHAWARRKVEYLKEVSLRIQEPLKETLKKVRDASKLSGDDARLSEADISVIALAIDTGGTILSDDYSIQNTATAMEIPFRSISQRGIKEVFKWSYRCKGCRRTFDKQQKECPVCGSEVKSWRGKAAREQGHKATGPQGDERIGQ
jgi:UPF0271 protein